MEKFTAFLYDIFGLCIPGLIVILTMDFKLHLINNAVNLLNNVPPCCTTFLFVSVLTIMCYIAGSILKIISEIFYQFMQRIFDNFINKKFTKNEFFPKIKISLEKIIGKDLYSSLASLFIYKSPQFDSSYVGRIY